MELGENAIRRIQPHSEEAEKCVLGSMLMDADAIVVAVDQLVSSDFYYNQHQMLFDAMLKLFTAPGLFWPT